MSDKNEVLKQMLAVNISLIADNNVLLKELIRDSALNNITTEFFEDRLQAYTDRALTLEGMKTGIENQLAELNKQEQLSLI